MSENQDLLARIGRLAGHINLHKAQTPPHDLNEYSEPPQDHTRHRIATAGRSTPWKSIHGVSYHRPRARAGKSTSNPHRNRTLVLNKTTNTFDSFKDLNEMSSTAVGNVIKSDSADDEHVTVSSATRWVAKRDRHMQLIKSSIFDKETQLRTKAIDETRRQKAQQKDEWEKHKIEMHFRSLSSPTHRLSTLSSAGATPTSHQITINGLAFQVINGGSKLLRIRNADESVSLTPKKANVGGVTFFRSRNGNLYRSGVIKVNEKFPTSKKGFEPCKRFSITGNCSKGPLCRYAHDPTKVAICKDFLQRGTCVAGEFCDLSHDPSPERVPACLHFLRGKCSNPSCRYAHVRVNPSAHVCRDFAVMGYCGRGAVCTERHVHECPDYANNGVCGIKTCHLPHVHRAGQIRKHAAKSMDITKLGFEQKSGAYNESDLSSDELDIDKIDSDDVDSDGIEDEPMQLSDNTANQTSFQQEDFVHF